MPFRFDVAFSFAGPHREKVRAIAALVATTLGSNMDVLLQRIYHDQNSRAVTDLSEDYADREWTQAEAGAIRALRKKIDTARDEPLRLRLLNIRIGKGDVPGILGTEATSTNSGRPPGNAPT